MMGWLARSLVPRAGAPEWKSTADTLELFKQIFGAGREANTGDSTMSKFFIHAL